MIPTLDHTHDASVTCWVESARRPDTEFPVQNLPFGVVREADGPATIAVPIGDRALLLPRVSGHGDLATLPAEIRDALAAPTLNGLMALGPDAARTLRRAVFGALVDGGLKSKLAPGLVPLAAVAPVLPARIGDYTDFYASVHHATNVGSMFRPDNPLLPNYKWVPIGYHGRASSVVVSGTSVRRPRGQTKDDQKPAPTVGPSRGLDYECEVGIWVGAGNRLGEPIPIERAAGHFFGLSLLNDWSARDLQRWEYQPLGPFLSKSFATTVSPWIVTADALAPFRAPAAKRAEGDPAPLPYLSAAEDQSAGAIELELEVALSSSRMRAAGMPPMSLSRSSFASLYWTVAQLITHHASNGCNLAPGDLLGSGTVSGPTRESRGCLLELTWRGSEPLDLPTGETRRFLEDGDEVMLRGRCRRDGFVSIGFGDCRGVVTPA
ncbi:MAG: fumarylacetoacetase [Gemmatimonadales bacterium]